MCVVGITYSIRESYTIYHYSTFNSINNISKRLCTNIMYIITYFWVSWLPSIDKDINKDIILHLFRLPSVESAAYEIIMLHYSRLFHDTHVCCRFNKW